jgi:diadenosine tetraphosphate (Ap4A) HIT family hydrolase
LEDIDRDLIADMFFVAKKVAKDLWISEGYNLKFNVWKKGWQEVMHIHLHLLSDI